MDAVHRSCSAVTAFRPAWTPASPRVGPRSPVLLRRDRLPPSERALSVPLADGGTAAGALAWCGRRPAHYFADTPDGAWAEFLRHENITDPEDLDGVRETIWAIELPDDLNLSAPELPPKALLGGTESYPACQAEGVGCERRRRGSNGDLGRAGADAGTGLAGSGRTACGTAPRWARCRAVRTASRARGLARRRPGPSGRRAAEQDLLSPIVRSGLRPSS